MTALVAGLAAPSWAAACCGGPPVDPVALGPGERVGGSVGVLGGWTPARWASDGSVHPADDRRLVAAVGGRFRLADPVQVGVSVPVSTDSVRGPGLDDPTLSVRIEPGADEVAHWEPTALAAVTVPLGRRLPDLPPWWEAAVGLGLERAGHRSGVAGYAVGTLPVWSPERPPAHPGLGWEVGAAGGPRGEWGSVAVGGAIRGTAPGRIDGTVAGVGSAHPVVRGTWTTPVSPEVRVVAAAEAGPPVPYVGREADAELVASVTLFAAAR